MYNYIIYKNINKTQNPIRSAFRPHRPHPPYSSNFPCAPPSHPDAASVRRPHLSHRQHNFDPRTLPHRIPCRAVPYNLVECKRSACAFLGVVNIAIVSKQLPCKRQLCRLRRADNNFPVRVTVASRRRARPTSACVAQATQFQSARIAPSHACRAVPCNLIECKRSACALPFDLE